MLNLNIITNTRLTHTKIDLLETKEKMIPTRLIYITFSICSLISTSSTHTLDRNIQFSVVCM